MLRLICGRAGSGKTTLLFGDIAKNLEKEKPCLLITPEQQAVLTEKKAAKTFSGANTFLLEILNFRRLADFVFRKEGGLCEKTIDRTGKQILMWRALSAAHPFLCEYANVSPSDTALISLLFETCESLRKKNVTPSAMERIAKALEKKGSARLARKCADLSLILSTYAAFFRTDFPDVTEESARLASLLEKVDFFKGYAVYLDSFDGFTEGELSVLAHILRQADEVEIALCYDPCDKALFEETDRTREQLFRLCENHEEVFLEKNRSFVSEKLRRIEKNFPSPGRSHSQLSAADGEGFRAVSCRDPYDECLFAAEEISSKVRNGARYRDFAVVCRDPSRYEGLIDSAFESVGVPIFLSRRISVREKAAVRCIFTAISVFRYGWREEDVVSHVKTGMTPLSQEECALLEDYVRLWSVSGKRWTNDEEWTANPDGFLSFDETGKAKAKLQKVNAAREKLVPPLLAFSEEIRRESTVREKCAALFRFLKESGVPEKIRENALKSGTEEEDRLVWKSMCDSLDKLVLTAGDVSTGEDGFVCLLKLLFSSSGVSLLPVSTDEVLFGAADRIRTDGVKYAYLLGCNSGVFPADPRENAVFSDDEKKEILEGGFDFLPLSTEQIRRELFTFYRACAIPSTELVCVFSSEENEKPSPVLTSLCALCGEKPAKGRDLLARAEGYRHSVPLAAEYPDTPVGAALREIYSADPSAKAALEAAFVPLSAGKVEIGKQDAEKALGKDLYLSQSRTDRYAACPFSFYLRYIACLEEEKDPGLQSLDLGNYFHKVYEKGVPLMEKTGWKVTREEAEEIVGKITEEYFHGVYGGEYPDENAAQTSEILARKAAFFLQDMGEKIASSELKPTYYELNVGQGGISPAEYALPDGGKISIRGKIDRADTLEREDGRTHFRVVDYKTGEKKFDPKNVEKGKDLQLPLYLFALRDGLTPGVPAVPEEALYLSTKIGNGKKQVSPDQTSDEAREELRKTIVRSGLRVTEEGPGKKGEIVLYREKDLAGLEETVRTVLLSMGEKMKNGVMDATPSPNSCKYCRFFRVCRSGAEDPSGNEGE